MIYIEVIRIVRFLIKLCVGKKFGFFYSFIMKNIIDGEENQKIEELNFKRVLIWWLFFFNSFNVNIFCGVLLKIKLLFLIIELWIVINLIQGLMINIWIFQIL